MNRFCSMISVLLIASQAFCANASSQISQQPYIWRNVKVGGGGFIPGIVFSRVEKGLVYLRSDIGGCYRWDDSQKRWIPMQDAMAESSYFGGESIAPDPIDANTVYIAAGMYRTDPSAMLRSRDRGKTWDVFPVTFRMGGNEDGRGVGERLAIDPNDNTILFFGSRNDGLWRSEDSAQTWKKVAGFPIRGRGLPGDGQPSNTGLSFVIFDPRTGSRGFPTRTLFVGSADPGAQHLFRSDDGGITWTAVAGGPAPEMLPAQAQIDDAGFLYITYANGTGPNGVSDGAVMKFDTLRRTWADITPDKRADRPKGGYCGLSLDRQHPGTLGVTTMNRWMPVDTVWRSTDGGETWMDIAGKSERDVRATPFLFWGKDEAKLGWWMSAFAIDPFDSNHAAYATGATVYATNDFANVSAGRTTHWFAWVEGIEQTAIVTLLSPSEGAHLLSGFGDIGGFVHDDLSVSPADMYENPQFGTTVTLDCAGVNPLVVVRSGQPNEGQSSLGYSMDGGQSWNPLSVPASATRPSAGASVVWPSSNGHPAIAASADGNTFIVLTRIPLYSRNHGASWTPVEGLFEGARPITDRVDPSTFYAINFSTGKLFASADGGATFKASNVKGLLANIRGDQPAWREGPWPLLATPGKPHDLWFISNGALFHSADGGKDFTRIDNPLHVDLLGFGKAAKGTDYPSLFAIAAGPEVPGGIKAIWRSDDMAASWIRVNDDQHQYGTRFRCIAGDPRIFGRVYVGTDGRGVLYGQPAGAGQ